MDPTFPLAFTAGVLSFLSPCVLPLVPSYLAFVGGNASAAASVRLRNSVLFVTGFSLVFIALGASASAVGSLLRSYRGAMTIGGGVLVIAFGLILLGVIRVPWLYRDTRMQMKGDPSTPAGALVLGMAFAGGWTPCIGPVLGGILTLAGASGTLATGVSLLSVYALGLAIPFLLAAVAMDRFLRVSRGLRKHLGWIERGAGTLLVIAGLLMITGTYTSINNYLIRITPDWLYSRL